MTQIADRAGTSPGEHQAEGLEVRIARELLEQARPAITVTAPRPRLY